jgi:hypothetical protein
MPTPETQPRHIPCAGLFVFQLSSEMRTDLGQHVPERRKINAMVPVGIGPIGERGKTNNYKNAPQFSLPQAMPELGPAVLAV